MFIPIYVELLIQCYEWKSWFSVLKQAFSGTDFDCLVAGTRFGNGWQDSSLWFVFSSLVFEHVNSTINTFKSSWIWTIPFNPNNNTIFFIVN